MKLKVLRFSSEVDSTSGLLFKEDESGSHFLAYTLEDEARNSFLSKVSGETRIPAGTYKITLRIVGKMTKKYEKRFKNIHKGMLWVRDIPNFEYILIHCGNTDEHTAGCLLVGDSQTNNQISPDGFIGQSSKAYARIYPEIAQAIENGEEVLITYVDYD